MAKIVDENCMYIYISFIRFGQRSIKTFLGYLSSIITWADLLKISSKLIRRWNFIMSFIIRSKIRIITCKYLGLAFFPPSLFLPIYRYITTPLFFKYWPGGDRCAAYVSRRNLNGRSEEGAAGARKSSREKRGRKEGPRIVTFQWP